MKQVLTILLATTLIISLTGCTYNGGAQPNSSIEEESTGSTSTVEKEESDSSSVETTDGYQDANKIIIAYFSYSGNTEKIANIIAENTGGDLVRIETTNPYPEDYNEVLDVAKKEQEDNARPELSTDIENIDDYDIIFLGYPIWWGTMPMAVFSFLEKYDLSGKTIVPFCTHGGSAFGTSDEDIDSISPDATLLEGIAVRESDVDSAKSDVEEWISSLDIVE